MPIDVKWDNEEKTCIYYGFTGRWTWDEFDTVYEDVYNMLDTVDHTVHAIVDLQSSNLLPKNTLTKMRYLTFKQHKNGGITIFITDNGFAHTLFHMLTGIVKEAKRIFRIAHTQKEAYQYINDWYGMPAKSA